MTYSQRKAQKARKEVIKCIMIFLVCLVVISLVGLVVASNASLNVADTISFVGIIAGVFTTCATFAAAMIFAG